jgi:hypothetical protein
MEEGARLKVGLKKVPDGMMNEKSTKLKVEWKEVSD